MAGDKFDQLYNALKADGAVTGTREHFRKFVYAPGKQGYHNRKQLYDALHADGAVSSNSYEEFAQRLGLHAVNPKPQQKPVAQQKPMTTAQRAMQVPRQYQRTQLSKAPKSAPKNASPFVQSLYEIDDAQKGVGYPVDYTSPKAIQQVYQRNQRIRRQAAKTAAKKISRQASHAQPIMQTNTPADTYIGKTEGQLMDEMNQSANALVGSEMGDYLDKVIGDEFKAAHARGLAVLSANSGVHGTGGADWWIGERAYQNQMDQDKQLQEITGNIQKNIGSIFSNPKVKQRVLSDAQKLGVSPETYIESSLAPALIEKAEKQFYNTQLNRMMAKGASDYIASGILNSLTGTLLTGLTTTKSQRQMQQQADAMTEEGLNPNYKPGTWAKAAKGAVAFAADLPWYYLTGFGAGALIEKVFGKAVQQMARVANQSLRQRVFEGVARGIVRGGATGFQYGAINGAVQNYSTGEDTSLWGTLKAAAKGGWKESVSFATMEGMGGAVGAFGHGIGLKGTEKTWKQRVNKMGQKLTYEGIKTGMEGIGMTTGGVASSYANHILTGDDWHGFSTEGTLESCASAVIFKLTHAKDLFKKETDRNGKPFSFTSNIAQKTARFFLSGEAKSAPHVFSDEEKHQLFAAGSELGMKPMENIVSWAKQAKKYRAEDIEKSEDGSDLLNNYQQIMQDPNVSWDAKAKFTTMVMGTMPESRPMMDHISYGTEEGTDGDNRIHTYKTINEYASDGTLLSKHRFDTKDKRESIIYEIGARKEELRSKNALALLVGLDRNNYDLQNSFFKKNAKDWEQVQEIVEGMQTGGSKTDHQFTEYVLNSERGSFLPIVDAVASKNGMNRESMLNAFYKDPMKRSDAEQNACVQLRKAIEMEVFPANKVHEEQSVMDGKDVATDNNLGTEQPNGEAVKAELNGLKQAEAGMDELMRDNDVFGQNFQKLKQQGLTNPQIYDWMVQQGGLTVEQLEPFAHYINANARVQGMQEATKNAIDEQVSSYVQDWSFHGTLNGQEKNGEQAIYVQDSNGRTLLVGTGEVAFDTTTGRAKEGVGDMLVCLDPKTGETVYVKSYEVKFVGTRSADDFANGYRQELQMKNSEPYNQAAQEQAMQDAAKPQPAEKSKDDATKGGDLTKDDTTLTKVDTTSGKDNTTSEDLVPQEQPQQTRKFADGSDVSMTKDSKGRPTPDYEKMTPEQSAEILTEDFGENAEKVVDGQIQKAEKALKDAEKMKVDYTAEPNDIMEQEALKNQTIQAAKKQLDHAQNIKKAMTAKKVAETVGNTEQTEGAHEAGSVAAQKFVNAPRLVGNKRTRMLPDGETKIKGHYEIVPAESLTPSHDVNNGYKKSEGFPTDAEGRTVNDRDYEHDKAAQQNTDQIARKYNGMAIEQVPVVSDEGIVYDGNGRTMAGQKAAKEGTDGEYINDLLENAENFGFTREQIEQSGIEHPRLVLVTDERLPYDTATFSKFNRNEKKTQSNTEQAVAKAKTLTSDEVGAIVAEIEGSGSLDAFFNNSKAINDLVKTLVDKGIIGQNEVAQMMDNPERLSAQGREYVKNLLLGSIFKPETIRMLGIDSAVKNKVVNAIRSVMDNMKLGDYSLRDEIDQAIQLLYEARQGGNKVDTLLRTPDMFGEDAAKRYPSISQMMALALEGKVADFRDLLDEYNRIAASRNTGEGNMFEAAPTKEELINEYLNFKKWQDYGTGHSENEGGNDVSGIQEPKQETSEGNGSAGEGAEPEPAVKVNNAIKKIATEITKQTGIEVVTDEKEAQRALEDADSDVKYSREAGGAVLDWGNVPSKARISNDELTTIIMRNNREYIDELDKLGEGEFIEHYVDANGYFYTFRVDKNHHIYMDEAISKTSSANRERINELKEYYDGERARYSEEVRSNRSESQSELGRSEDSYRSTIGTGNSENSAMGGRIGESDSKGNVERDTSRPEQSGSALKEFRSANGEVYGFTVGGKIYLDTKKMKPETPLHEYTHLWTEALRNTNPEEWENVKGLFDKVDGLKDEIQKLYPELKGDALYEEMISTFSGREGAKKLEETVRNLAQQEGKSVEESAKATGFLGKVKEALQRYWKGVADMLHIHFTSAEDVADKVLADWAKGANPKDYKAKEEPVETKREEAKTEKSKDWTDEEIDKLSSVESKWQEKVDDYISENYPAHNGVRSRTTEEQAKYDAETEAMKEDATLAKMRKDADAEYKATEEEIRNSHLPKDPMEGIKQAAGAFHEEQKQKGEFVMNLKLGKARQEYAEAKEHGDASEIKRTRDELKQLLDEHYKAQHMGLVQRRKEIAKEIGMTEAKKIDKPFSEMDSEEREYVANQNPLTESEIREQTSEENKNFIEDAVDYINGNHGFAQKMAYLKIYDDVRNRHENVSDNSGAENGTQLDAANTTGGEKLGLGRGRESGGSDGPVDRGTGNEAAPGEPEGREGNQNDTTLSVGKPGDKQGEGNSSDMGAVPSGNTDTKGSGSTGKDGNVSEQRGRESSNRPAKPDAKRKPAAKQGTTWRGRTGEEIKKNVADKKSAALAAIAELKKRKFGKGGSGHLGSFELLTPDQMEYVPTVMNAVKEYGMAIIDEGIYKVKDWFNHIRETFAGGLKDCGFTDQDIDDFIKEMWNSKMPMDGETHTIAEWCSIYGNAQLRKKLGEELDVKYQKQMDAEPIEVKIGDRKNIEETLPFLLPQQQDDVLKAETQFFGKDHTDREHAYGKGYMFTNGTGTGKTYTGLGIAKRLAKQGKGRILFITPSQKKVNDWMKDGKNLGLDIRDLDSVAKEKGTTATTESGDGMVITTFANFGLNKKLLETEWDAVIYDECHRIMENKKGAETARSMQHYMMTNRDENHCFLRLQTINPHYQKMQNAADRFNELRQKEVQRIQKEYKQSHPSATAKDVVNATFSQLPKELNSFALADATAFPKLGKAYQDFTSAKQHYYNNVEPKLKEQAKNTWKNTKTIFLSATPFNTRENLDYAEGYIFKFPEDDGSRMSGRSRFYLDHFGAAYRYRYNRLEAKTDNPAAVAKQEVAFSDYLQDTLGTMSGRIIDSAYDYSRDFPTVAPDHADEFNNAVEEAVKGRYLGEAYSRTIGDYNYGSALFETMKVANIIQRMKDHLAAGRKIVVFHRRVETKNPIQPPFAYMLEYANHMIAEMKPGKERNEAIKECTEFRNKYADLLDWEQTLDYSMPREQIAKVFGRDNVLFFSGKESKKVKDKAVDTFNDDNSGKNIIVIQEASGKEGISLHDVTGNHQRVLITLGLPQSPITALQIEGRTYRIGNKSNAIFEYPILGLNSEMMLFGQKFNNQVSTTENLALGSQARNLRDSFANGILEHSGIIPIDQQGVGGKEFDAPKQSDSDPFDDAVLDYYSNQKLNKNNREGVDYFSTPEPLGYKMVEWANMGEGDTALEPSAGHGAIARYVSKSNELLSIEPSQSLFAKLQLKAGGLGRKFLNNTFENYNVANKHDVVVMNPPFGTAGTTAIAHLDKAFRHLDEGGRVVAIIPRGSTDKKFDKWYGEQKNAAMRAEVDLPDIVFQQAGTNVRCRVVVLDKITDDTLRSKAGYPEKIDLSGHYDKIEDFFEDLRDVQMPDRIIDTQMKSMKKARTFKKDIEDNKGMTVTIEKNGISVFDKNAYRDYSISFPSIKHNEEWTKENYSKVYERFDQEQNRVYSENSKAALDEMKKLACKLAGMSEEEMQKYISDKKNGGTKFRTDHGDGNYPASSVESHVEKVAQKTGGKVKMVSSVDEITNKAAKAAIEEGRKITGWYDENTGEVHLYMPNIHDRYTAEKTIWHEVVGHKGMRELFGEERFEKFLRDVWYDLDKPENAALKKLVDEERKFNPMNIYDAIEEGIARLAEDGKGEAGFWNGIKNKVSDFLHEIGYRIAPNTKDVKYLLWLSKNLQKNPNDPYWKLRAEAVKYRLDHEDIRSVVERNGMYFDNDGKNHDYLLDLNHKDFEEATDGKVHFRTTPTTASKIEEYNRRLATKLYAFKESTVDHMQSLQEAMEVISGEKDVWNNIPSSFNPLMAQNSMDSKVQQVSDSYDRKITEPLGEVFQKVVALVDGKNKDEQLRNAQLYMITKHGLERNRVFFVRDAIRVMKKDKNPNVTSLQAEWAKKHKDLSDDLEKGKIRFDEYFNQMDEWIRSNVDISYVADEHDYSGFHGMQGKEKSDTYDDKLAIDNVMSVESKLSRSLVKDFWSKKKAATDYIIDQQYTGGFVDEVERDYLKGMFQWYVPLRKFDGTTAEDIYGYITEKGDITNYVGPTLANAKGRSSLSDVNVLAQITAMAKTSIINAGENVVKQHLARFISAYENGDAKNRIFVEINPWAEKHTIDGNEVWEEVTPQIPEDATQEQISNILQSFENSMKAKQASGDAKLLKNKADIGFKFQRAKNKSEHIVDVYIAGKKKSFVCQGNPRAAQAINGLLVDSGTRNAISEIDAKVTRKLAQFNTSFNPDFMSSNMLRDLTSASANVTKEGFKYTKDFLKEYAKNMRSITNLSGRGNYLTMFRRYREDKLDMNNEREKMFKEFMDNGGQTGFIQIKKFEDLIKEYNNLIEKGNKDADRWLVKKIKKGASFIEAANEIVEGIARYSTYCTSRKHGRSIGKSVYDAKEVSGNFNRHGSGDAIGTLKTEYDSKNDKRFRGAIGFFNSWMKNHTQFYNAGVQGANLLFKNYKSATITTAISFGFMPFGLGLAQALINQYLISREDEKDRNGVKDPYAELPEWKRRNNICIYWGHGKFKTIPLGIELRASFGIGDIAAGYVVNENLKSDTPIGYDILGQIAQLVPASDFLGHHSPSSSIKEVGEDVLLGVTPTTIKAFGELGFNRDWTGRPFYRDKDYLDKAPRWKSAYDNTSDIYMTINKWANQSTNGIDASNPDMKGNETLDYLTAPYGWQHVIDSYTGGMGSTIRRIFDTGSAAIKGVVSGVKSEEGFGEGFSKEWSKLDKNQIPLYRVFNYTPSEGNNMQRTKSKWYNYTDEFEQIEYNLSQMKTDTPDLVKNVENHSKQYKFVHSDEGKAYNIWKAADDFIYKKRRDLKKTNDPVVKKSIEEQINIKMQEAVNDLDKLN